MVMMARGKFLILACLLGILASAVQAAPPSASPTPKIVPPYGLYEKFDSSVVTAASILPSLPPRPALGLSSDEELDTLFFLSFQKDFKRRYTSQAESTRRFASFRESLRRVDRLNLEQVRLGGTPAFGITKYSDWSREEIKQYLLPGVRFPHDHGITKEKIIRSTKNNPVKGSGTSPSSLSTGVPVDLDWRDKGAVTPVRNQGLKCGSCWAHSASQTVESLWYLAGKGLPSLSVQQLVSCDSDDEACRGGFPISAYRYISKAGGLEGESTYPYVSGMGDVPPCAFNKSNVVAKINGFSWAESDGNEKNLIKILSDVGPLSVCVDAHNWPDYKSGVITTCGSWIDHCVQLVGYKNYTSAVDTILQSSLSSASSSSPNDMTVTTSSTTPSATPSSTAAGNPYYIIRNSWDTDWGEAGYVNLAITGKNLCGIATRATYVRI